MRLAAARYALPPPPPPRSSNAFIYLCHRITAATEQRSNRRGQGTDTKWVKGGKRNDDRPTGCSRRRFESCRKRYRNQSLSDRPPRPGCHITVVVVAALLAPRVSFALCASSSSRSAVGSSRRQHATARSRNNKDGEREREREEIFGGSSTDNCEREKDGARKLQTQKKKEGREAVIEIEAESDVVGGCCAADLLGRFLLLRVHFYLRKKSLSLCGVGG